MAYPVTHFEINAQDAPATQKFYRDLFGWGIDTNNPDNYGMIDTKNEGTGINGGIGASQQGKSWVTFYVECDDPAATLAKVERLGGRRVMEPMESMNVVYALFADPEGNVIGLAKTDRTQQEQRDQEQEQKKRSRSNGNGNGTPARSRAKTTATGKASTKRASTRKRTTAKKTTTRPRSKRSRG
ncbi:MAG: VOC family protein [Chloroflexota bacterium]|nr:VOC family protein [Chloroflexota bacterium]